MLLKHKPTIKFDPSNKLHRQVVREYLETGRLSTDQFKFTPDAKYVSVAHQIQSELVKFYLDKELVAKRKKEEVAAW